jgi:hypothetical protein
MAVEREVEIRCKSRKHGNLIDGHIFEVKCSSRGCADWQPGVVVLHRFDLSNGTVRGLETLRFKNPERSTE